MDEHTPCQCDICKVRRFERNNYFHGKVLSARDLAEEQRYFNEKRWLINRAVLGWGVVCGLDVALDNGALTIQPGLALDCCGHEILVCDPQCLKRDTFSDALGRKPGYPPPSGYPPQGYQAPPGYQTPPAAAYPQQTSGAGYTDYGGTEPIRWVVCLEYKESRTEQVKPPSSCEKTNGHDYNRIRDDFTLAIRTWDDACPDDHDEDCCPYDGLGSRTPLHKALVERSKTCAKCKDCSCVVLATGTLDASGLHLDDDHWKYRRLVHTNGALASVIRCLHGGLPHIAAISWAPNANFRVDEFLDCVTQKHLQVTFDQKMKARTVTNVRSCRLSIFIPSSDGHCPMQLFIPVQRIDYDYDSSIATYYFDDDCIDQELRKTCKRLKRPADVELILYGNVIHNEHGRALDAELIEAFPTGNGVEGGDFITYFTVGP